MALSAVYHGHASYSVAIGATGTVLTVPSGSYGNFPYVALVYAANGYTSGIVQQGAITLVYSGGSKALPTSSGGVDPPVQLLDSRTDLGLPSGWANAGFTVTRSPTANPFSGNPERGVIALALITGLPTLGILTSQGTQVATNAQDASNPHSDTIDISFLPTRAVIGAIGGVASWRSPTSGSAASWTTDSNWANVESGVNTVSSIDAGVSIGLMSTPPTPRYTNFTASNLSTRTYLAVTVILDAVGSYSATHARGWAAVIG